MSVIARRSALAAAALLSLATPAAASNFLAHKAKDLANARPGAKPVQVMRAGVPLATSCELKKVQFHLENVGIGFGSFLLENLVCYQAKCDDELQPTSPVGGTTEVSSAHALEVKKAKLVCVPYDPHRCGDGGLDAGEECDGLASFACPGQCQSDCTCPQPSCPAPGVEVGGSCWFQGTLGESCDTVCTAQGLGCDVATITYAGSEGSNAGCDEVVTAFAGGSIAVIDQDCGAGATGIGCVGSIAPVGVFRCTTPPTTCAAANPQAVRYCSCQ